MGFYCNHVGDIVQAFMKSKGEVEFLNLLKNLCNCQKLKGIVNVFIEKSRMVKQRERIELK